MHTLILAGELDSYEELRREQLALRSFHPFMLHSVHGEMPPRMFHPQMIADFKTVDEIGWKILAETERPSS